MLPEELKRAMISLAIVWVDALTEICSIHNNDDFWFPCLPLDAENLTQQSNLKLLQMEKLPEVDKLIAKLAVVGSAQGTGPAVLNSAGVLDTMICVCFGYYFESNMVQN